MCQIDNLKATIILYRNLTFLMSWQQYVMTAIAEKSFSEPGLAKIFTNIGKYWHPQNVFPKKIFFL